MQKLGIALAAAALAACIAVEPQATTGPAKARGNGPPPHAPAHGYRAKTPQGVNIVFDTQVGVYVVVDLPGSYWLDDRYYRESAQGWLVGAGVDGPWAACASSDLPPGLREISPAGKKHGKKSKAHDDD